MVVTFMCARDHAPHVKHCKCMASLYKHMGKLQSAITLIQRRESKIPSIKFLVLTYSACSCKNYGPKCSQKPHELNYLNSFFFFRGNHTLSRKKNCLESSTKKIVHIVYTLPATARFIDPTMCIAVCSMHTTILHFRCALFRIDVRYLEPKTLHSYTNIWENFKVP